MSRTEWTRRFLLFLLSLFFTALGVALTKHGALGVSPISSVGNVMSCRFPALSLGNWLILWNCLLILGQMLLLGRRFRLFQLLQLPLSFLFGWFTDFGLWGVWRPFRRSAMPCGSSGSSAASRCWPLGSLWR